jgi:hypothetical protein
MELTDFYHPVIGGLGQGGAARAVTAHEDPVDIMRALSVLIMLHAAPGR